MASPQIRVVVLDGMATPTAIAVRQNDVPAPATLALQDTANSYAAVDLTGATVTATLYGVPYVGAPHTGTKVFGARPCTVNSPATAGQVTLTWQAGDFAAPGTYELDVAMAVGSNKTTSTVPLVITVSAET